MAKTTTSSMLDDTWIVRFPRSVEQQGRFVAELNLLRALRDISRVRVPVYEFVALDGSFGAYRLIAGTEMTPPVFAAVAKRRRSTRLADRTGRDF